VGRGRLKYEGGRREGEFLWEHQASHLVHLHHACYKHSGSMRADSKSGTITF